MHSLFRLVEFQTKCFLVPIVLFCRFVTLGKIYDISFFFFLENDTNETQRLRQDLDEVRTSILNLECNTNRKNEEISLDLNEWQIHKAKLEEIRPWLENAEKNINIDHVKPITLQLANDWLKNALVSEAGGRCPVHSSLIFVTR